MSFTIARTYNLLTGTNYSQRSAIKFRGNIANGSTDVSVIQHWGANPISAVASMTSPVIVGHGVTKRDVVTGTAAGGIIQITNAATTDGSHDFYLIDDAYPSTYDMPIKAFHVLGAPGTFTFKTLDGATVSFTSAQLAVGGVYDYSISEVITLTNPNTILGLSPEGQRSIY